jgi:hypothetical protein
MLVRSGGDHVARRHVVLGSQPAQHLAKGGRLPPNVGCSGSNDPEHKKMLEPCANTASSHSTENQVPSEAPDPNTEPTPGHHCCRGETPQLWRIVRVAVAVIVGTVSSTAAVYSMLPPWIQEQVWAVVMPHIG